MIIDSVETEGVADQATEPEQSLEQANSETTTIQDSSEPRVQVSTEQGTSENAIPDSSQTTSEEPTTEQIPVKVDTTVQEEVPVRDYTNSYPIAMDQGKVHWWMQRCYYQDYFNGYMLQVPSDENRKCFNQIVSPCDKLLLKTLTGVQGGLLSHFIEPVHFTHYLVASNLCNHEALSRALYGRLEGVACVKPQIGRIRTHSFITGEGGLGRSKFAHVWAKGCELDILLPRIGKCIPLVRVPSEPGIHHETRETRLMWEKEELEGASPSSYNSLKFYQRFSELCKHLNIEVYNSSSEMKRSAKDYTDAKQAVKDKLQKDGHGTWPFKSVERQF